MRGTPVFVLFICLFISRSGRPFSLFWLQGGGSDRKRLEQRAVLRQRGPD